MHELLRFIRESNGCAAKRSDRFGGACRRTDGPGRGRNGARCANPGAFRRACGRAGSTRPAAATTANSSV
jgi:hypothetical protein